MTIDAATKERFQPEPTKGVLSSLNEKFLKYPCIFQRVHSEYDPEKQDGDTPLNRAIAPVPMKRFNTMFARIVKMTGLTDSDAIKNILMSNRQVTSCPFRSGRSYTNTEGLMGKQAFTTLDDDYRKLRNYFNNLLTEKQIHSMEHLPAQLRTHSLEVVEKMLQIPNGHVNNVHEHVSKLPSRVIQSWLFGHIQEGVQENMHKLMPEVKWDAIVNMRLFSSTKGIKDKDYYKSLKAVAESIWNEPDSYPGILGDMAKAVCKNGERMFSLNDIFSQMLLFLFAGEDTLSSALTFALYALGKHPEYQETLHEAIRKVYSEGEAATIEEIDSIPELDWFVKEVLRLFTPVPVINRRLNPDRKKRAKRDPEEGGHLIEGKHHILHLEENRTLAIYLFEALKDKEIWGEQACQFIPERHDPDQREKYGTPERWIIEPFSVGPNKCMGKPLAIPEVKAFLFYAIPQAVFSTNQELKFKCEVSLRTINPVEICISNRA